MHEGGCHQLPREMLAPVLASVDQCCSEILEPASRHRYPSLELRNSNHWCKSVSFPILLSHHVLLLHMSLGLSACPIFSILTFHGCALISYLLECSASIDHVLANPKMSDPTRTHWIQPAYKFRWDYASRGPIGFRPVGFIWSNANSAQILICCSAHQYK